MLLPQGADLACRPFHVELAATTHILLFEILDRRPDPGPRSHRPLSQALMWPWEGYWHEARASSADPGVGSFGLLCVLRVFRTFSPSDTL